MPRLGRPRVNGERDRLIFADVNELVRSKGLSLRSAYAKTAESGDFGAMSARTVESAYLKERQRSARRVGGAAAPMRGSPLSAMHSSLPPPLSARHSSLPPSLSALRNAQFLAAAAAPNAQFLAAVRRHSPLFRHLRFIQAPPLNC